MELGKKLDNSRALPRGVVLAVLGGSAVHEREESGGVAISDPTQRLAVAREDRREHEAEAGVAEGDRAAECASQAIERRVASVSEPGLPVEVIDGDEAAHSRRVSGDPVVAPEPDRRIVDRLGVEAPPVGQERLNALARTLPAGPSREEG